jgi:murein DD-endopeptidase MepM/ murein hydrolase activator NlpD
MSSYRSEAYYAPAGYGARHYQQQPPKHQQQQPKRPHPVARHAATARDYILGHAGRQIRLGPIAFWIVIGTLVIMAIWTIGTATYFAFREDVLTRLIGRQAQMQFAYEDRVAELRVQIDRITGRQLLDQENFEQKLDHLLRRQSALEARSASMNAVVDPSITGSLKLPARGAADPHKPAPLTDKSGADRRSSLMDGRGKNLESTLARVQASLDRVERSQVAALTSMEDGYAAKATRIRNVLAELGLNKGQSIMANSGTGGPFVPLKARGETGSFERQIYRINVARAQVDSLNRTLSNVPVRKPVQGEIDLSSGFGVRMDPFVGAPAMHTGLDFRGDSGDPIRATAAGKVVSAGWQGGYGKMVEIDHGNGFSTRYGHMSDIGVSVGQTVRIGQILGKIGSTGRSTGPHLHYETRVEDKAVDPQKFLRAGSRLGTL